MPSESLKKKLDAAKDKATKEMLTNAHEKGAVGVMDVTYQITNLNVVVYGTAYKPKSGNVK